MRPCIESAIELGHTRRRASGLIRTFVVAAATLAILLVCFSIYQSAQISTAPNSRSKTPRLMENPGAVDKNSSSPETPGVQVGGVTVGKGKKLQVSLYPPQGAEPFGEISLQEWIPVEGAPDKMGVTAPDIRLWTKDHHGIHVTAKEGLLEGQRKQGGIEPRRGTLSGDVVIEYDRLSRDERAKMPPELRDRIDPTQVVRIETQRIDFDREYGKLLIPGELRAFSPLDLDFRTADLEVRFNEQESRVETLRIARGGKLELRGQADKFGFSIPQTGGGSSQHFTVVDWLRMSLQARLDSREQSPTKPTEKTAKNDQPVTIGEDGIPTFHVNAKKPKPQTNNDVRYHAKFENDVDARQYRGEAMVAQLLADVLEVDRKLARQEAQPKPEPMALAAPQQPAPAQPPQPSERALLEWTGLLTVSAAPQSDTDMAHERITARGSPVHLVHPEGNAECQTFIYEPDNASVWLRGTVEKPVTARSPLQGRLTGVEVHTESAGEKLFVHVSGPGKLESEQDEPLGPNLVKQAAYTPSKVEASRMPAAIDFSDQLEIVGRMTKFTRFDLSGGVSTRDLRVVDRAAFKGNVKLTDHDTELRADALEAGFAPPTRRESRQAIEHLLATGNVAMKQGKSQLAGRELDAQLRTNDQGRIMPVTATITGDASAIEGDRSIRARDKIMVDFAEFAATPKEAHDSAARQPTKDRSWGAQRVRAYGDVAVVDPTQALDLSVEELDATISTSNALETALLKGTASKPAYAQVKELTVFGREINLNVKDDWADVPSEGRMSFRSLKDLDGRRMSEPKTIVINWSERMKYRGRENRAVFTGKVHATSENATTFDTEELVAEFEDVERTAVEKKAPKQDWGFFQGVADAIQKDGADESTTLAPVKFSKEPARLIATGKAVALTSESDPQTGELRNRARLEGPRLSVDLHREVSNMLIEGEGSLLIEDFSAPPASAVSESAGAASTSPTTPGSTPPKASSDQKGLFILDEQAGLSKTLITWKDAMWYNFSIAQTRFEGNVVLKYFSGAELAKIADLSRWSPDKLPPGRSTFLKADLLTVDFQKRDKASGKVSRPNSDDQRMGQLSAQSVRQFRAAGRADLQDYRTALTVRLNADEIIYERDRDLLAIHGTPAAPAQLISQKPRELPFQSTFLRAFYQISTNELDVTKTTVR